MGATDEARRHVRKFYEENIWVNDSHLRRMEEAVERDGLSVEDVDRALAEHSQAVAFAKRMFSASCRAMTRKDLYYRFTETIFPVGKQSVITVSGMYKYQRISGRFKVVISPFYNYAYGALERYTPFTTEVTGKDNQIEILYCFDHEDLYDISVFYLLDGEETLLFRGNVYALEEDLFGKKFYKADLHIHSTFSDGCEAPELVAASARECGMDIIAVTDHNSFYGSLAARERAKELGLDLTVLTGIEYAMAYSPMHILSIGAERSVDRSFLGSDLAKSGRVLKIIEEHPDLSCDAVAYACTQILLDEIQKTGGIIVLAHPYWKPIHDNGSRKDTPENLFVELAREKRFTGYELVSGSPLGECQVSHLQASLVREISGGDMNLPLLGITDSHHYTTDDICGKHFTVIISDSKGEEDVLEALRKGLCVPVEIENGKPLCYGSHRLNKLAMFLVGSYFPERDRLARLEAMMVKEKN
jgi:hypothetical protein